MKHFQLVVSDFSTFLFGVNSQATGPGLTKSSCV